MCPSLIRSPLKSNHVICINPPLEPPSLEMLLVLLNHVVALKAAAVAQPLHDLHQPNLAGVEGKQQTRQVHKLVWDCKHTSQNVQEDLYLHEKKRKQLHFMESTEAQKPAGLVKSKQVNSSDHRTCGRVTCRLGSWLSHLVSYLDNFLSSQAVFPPPKFWFAVLSKPWHTTQTF